MNALKSLTSHRRRRSGFSIIEVLTSIVVAMIGVFGVMILIPFAVKQAQTGLDSDAAAVTARNGYAAFEVNGYRIPTNWGVNRGGGIVTAYSPFAPADTDGDGLADAGPDPPALLSIDPLGIAENNGDFSLAVFPFNGLTVNGATPYPGNLVITPVNLGSPTGELMNQQMAQRMFRAADDLVFGNSVDDALGPEQYYYVGGGTLSLARQSEGRLSWSAIVEPVTDNRFVAASRWSYRMYILVYKERRTYVGASLGDPQGDQDGRMLTAMLEPQQNIGFQSPVSTIYLEPGVYVEGGVRKDDWVMLINRLRTQAIDGPPPAGVTYAESGFDRQIGFYRVTGISNGFGAPNAANRVSLSSLTLDGPDFNFGDPAGVTGGTIDPDGLIRETHIVHLKDVVGVYEKTFAPEYESNWTLNPL